MFRWPIALTPLSLGSGGLPYEATVEVTPRGALFTLAALSHVGHPAHLALVDAYLKGQVRTTPTTSIGEDSRIVAASLAVPLLAADALGVERLTLADLVLVPRETDAADLAEPRQAHHSPDDPRLLLRAAGTWHRVRGAARFEPAGCLGTPEVGRGDRWHHVVAELSESGSIVAEVRAPSEDAGDVAADRVAGCRAQDLVRFGRSSDRARGEARRLLASVLPDLHQGESEMGARRRWRGLEIDATLVSDLDGFQALCLLPPADAAPGGHFEPMRDLACEVIEGLIGRPLAERRTEPIELRLIPTHGHSVTLDVGASVVISRNQTVFAAWVGSDGRVMIRLFPPGGMTGR